MFQSSSGLSSTRPSFCDTQTPQFSFCSLGGGGGGSGLPVDFTEISSRNSRSCFSLASYEIKEGRNLYFEEFHEVKRVKRATLCQQADHRTWRSYHTSKMFHFLRQESVLRGVRSFIPNSMECHTVSRTQRVHQRDRSSLSLDHQAFA